MIYYVLASIAGLFAGFAGAFAWRYVIPGGYNRSFWKAFAGQMSEMMAKDDPDDFWAAYKSLLLKMLKYTGKSLIALVLIVLPTVIVFYGVFVPLSSHWGRSASDLIVVVDSSAVVGDGDGHLTGEGNVMPIKEMSVPWDGKDNIKLSIDSAEVSISDASLPNVFCLAQADCYLYVLLGFNDSVLDVESKQISSIVVRPDTGSKNPFWPLLSDLDVAFFASLIIGMFVFLVMKRSSDETQ